MPTLRLMLKVEPLIHSIKTAIACMIGALITIALAYLFKLPASPWIVMSIIVVMCSQIYVGSVIYKAYLRFLGTVVGCLFAVIALVFFGHTNLITTLTVGLSSLIFSYLATTKENISYAGTLGAATTAVILLSASPTLFLAGTRFFEISIGILIATLISQFVMPIHARSHLRRTQAQTLEQLSQYFATCVKFADQPSQQPSQHEELDEIIIQTLSKQRLLAKEAKREPLGDVFDPAHFLQSLHCEKEMLRAVSLMHQTISHIKHQGVISSALLKTFNETVLASLKILVNAIETGEPQQQPIHILPLKSLKEDLEQYAQLLTSEERTYVDSFVFAAETFTTHLLNLARLYNVPVS